MPSWMKSFVLLFLGFIHIGLYAQISLNVQIPGGSKMHLYSPDEYVSLTSFSGVETLRGTLLVRNRSKKIDDETEWRLVLGFLPDKASQAKLPVVRYAGELKKGEVFVELNSFDKSSLPGLVGRLFGDVAQSKIGKEAFEISMPGDLTLSGFRTGVECDRRYYYASFENFKIDDVRGSSQQKKKVLSLPSECS